MLTIAPALFGLCCDGAHDVTQTPPYAVLAIHGLENVYLCLCRTCAAQLVTDIQVFLVPEGNRDSL
jgi:hypothetical protein